MARITNRVDWLVWPYERRINRDALPDPVADSGGLECNLDKLSNGSALTAGQDVVIRRLCT